MSIICIPYSNEKIKIYIDEYFNILYEKYISLKIYNNPIFIYLKKKLLFNEINCFYYSLFISITRSFLLMNENKLDIMTDKCINILKRRSAYYYKIEDKNELYKIFINEIYNIKDYKIYLINFLCYLTNYELNQIYDSYNYKTFQLIEDNMISKNPKVYNSNELVKYNDESFLFFKIINFTAYSINDPREELTNLIYLEKLCKKFMKSKLYKNEIYKNLEINNSFLYSVYLNLHNFIKNSNYSIISRRPVFNKLNNELLIKMYNLEFNFYNKDIKKLSFKKKNFYYVCNTYIMKNLSFLIEYEKMKFFKFYPNII